MEDRKNQKERVEKAKKESLCLLSPTGVHYWKIDAGGYGICFYCKEGKNFATELERFEQRKFLIGVFDE
jgi:hypothetical protein